MFRHTQARLTASRGATGGPSQHQLVVELDAVFADQGDLGLQRLARAIDATDMQLREPEAVPLIEADRREVVVGGDQPLATRRVDERTTDALPPALGGDDERRE